MYDEPSTVNCYQCGKPNVGKFFCNEEDCHQKWKDAHPVRRAGTHKMEISEIQEKILGWKNDPTRWRPAFSEPKQAEDMTQKELELTFS